MGKEHLYKTFEELDKAASLGGGMARIEKQHEAGRMTARERIDMLLGSHTSGQSYVRLPVNVLTCYWIRVHLSNWISLSFTVVPISVWKRTK